VGLKAQAVMDSIYMCIRVNPYKPENYGCPSFHKNLFDANRYALNNAKTWVVNIPLIGIINQRATMCVCIFEIPFGLDVPIYQPDFSSMDDEMWDYHIKTVWDRETSAARLIQNIYRSRFKLRVKSATIIQNVYREAIANPYILLCKRRLLREFNEMC
jgi:hypothetical protein